MVSVLNGYVCAALLFVVTFCFAARTPDYSYAVCSGLTRLVSAGYSRNDSGASREHARILWHVQDGSVHMHAVLSPFQLLSCLVDFK